MGSPGSWLQKWQKNGIVRAIEKVGLDPKEFDLEEGDEKVRIKHKWSASYSVISREGSSYIVRDIVGDGQEWPRDKYTWQSVISRIETWLAEVKTDLATPDLWASLQRDGQLLVNLNSDAVAGNTTFTSDEKKYIEAQLKTLAEHAQHTYSLSTAQMGVLNKQLDYLVEASRRVGRKDWFNIFAGAMFGLILTAVLSPEAVRATCLGLFRAIGHLYGLP
jgi:hypothetical protein